MKRTALLLSVLLGAFFPPAFAQMGLTTPQQITQPLHLNNQNCGLPMTLAYREFLTTSGGFRSDMCLIAPPNGTGDGWQLNGIAASARTNFNGSAAKAVGGYFAAEGFGEPTPTPGGYGGEVVGVYGRAQPRGRHWATGLHGECMSESDGDGVCIGANVEVGRGIPLQHGQQDPQRYIGINVQPREATRGVTGLNFQRPETYKHSIDLNGTVITLGYVDGVRFCMVFLPHSQSLLGLRNCDAQAADVAFRLDMNWRPGMQTSTAAAPKQIMFAEHMRALQEHENRKVRAHIDMLLGASHPP
jgi:hypothetical protein